MTATTAPTDDRPIPDDPDAILAELADLRAVIDAADVARERRDRLWAAARLDSDTPLVTFAKLAEASGVAEPYVIKRVGQAKAHRAKPKHK